MEIKKRSNLLRAVIGCMSLMLLQLNSPFVNADGLETLGTPSTTILGPGQAGTGIISKGVGTELVQPGVINFNVPAGATVERALLYWEGYMFDGLGDDQILVDGNPVDGTLIQSGVLEIQTSNPDADSTAYRADITTLVSPGANSLSISGMDFDRVNHGAGVLVIINDGSAPAHIDVLDGNDFAYAPYAPLQDTTVEQVFSFAADTVNDRTATLDMMFASVAGNASGGTFRPSSIKVTVGASGTPVYYNDLLNSNDGQEWDSLQIPLTIPAGADQVKVQALSEDRGTTGGSVASFHWLTAGLAITPPPPPGGEGCTPGFYKNLRKHENAWGTINPDDLFSNWFEDAFPGKTLHKVLKLKGGGLYALGRHTVAALLNANNGAVAYDLTIAEVQSGFNNVYPTDIKSDYNAQKRIFQDFNELGCPINGKGEYPSVWVPAT